MPPENDQDVGNGPRMGSPTDDEGRFAKWRIAVVFDDIIRPDTTGIYCLKALKELNLAHVTHILPAGLAGVRPDLFDLFLYVDDGLDYEIPAKNSPSAFWAIDTHLNPERILNRGKSADLVFSAQRDGVPFLKNRDVNCIAWLPLACDADLHRKYDVDKKFDVCFVGNLNTEARHELARRIRHRYQSSFVGTRYFSEMAKIYSESRIVLNLSVRNDINMRVFEALSCGSLLLTNDLGQNGLNTFFRDGEHLIAYQDFDDLPRKLDHFLAHEEDRERIAAAGRSKVHRSHTYRHRMLSVLDSMRKYMDRYGQGEALTISGRGKTGPLVSIIVATCNQVEHTRRCVESVYACGYTNFELIIVDNGSVDGTLDFLSTIDRVRVIKNGGNQGFPAAVNQGIEVSTGDAILLLNNDTIVSRNSLDRMVKVLQSDPRIGLVGPCSNTVPGPQHVEAGYADVEYLEEFAVNLARDNDGATAQATVLGSFCLLISRRVIEQIGMFDEAFGIGTFDDYEYCCRATKAGFRCVIAQDVFVHHYGSVTLKTIGIDVDSLLGKNAELFRVRTLYTPVDANQRPCESAAEISIIIVTFNGLEFTKRCLWSLRECTDESYELIVVDNGSTDGTQDYILISFPGAKLLQNRTNVGFPAAANQGIRASRSETILLLNNDVVLTRNWLTRLNSVLKSSLDIGLVGPCSNNVSGSQQVDAAYTDFDSLQSFAREWAERHCGEVQDVERLVGFCLLFRREVIDKVGILDERFGIGNFEDDDFCRRARQAGFRAVIARNCFIDHFGSATFRLSGLDYSALIEKNRLLFHEKWSRAGREVCGNSATPSVRPQLTLCMIVRDSSRTLRECLTSVRPWVDEVVVVDTGSVDSTPQIVAEFGCKLHHFAWCDDFAKARNESLKHATGEWIFWMDSDDIIDHANGQKLRELVEKPHSSSTLGFVLQVHCPIDSNGGPYATHTIVDHVKVFRSHPGIRFSGRIHEQVLPAIRKLGGDVEWTEIFVVHAGSDITPAGRNKKQVRDIRILELDLSEDPDNSFALFNLGMTLVDMNQYADALNPLCRSLQLALPGESHIRKLYALLVQCYSGMGRANTATMTCLRGLEIYPQDPELLFRRGVLDHAAGRLEEAKSAFLAVIEGARPRHFSSLDQGLLGIKCWHNLALVYELQEQFGLAASAWKRVLHYDHLNRAAWYGLLNALSAGKDLPGLASAAEPNTDAPPEFSIIARARLMAAKGHGASAIDELQRAIRQYDSVDVLEELCELAFRHDALDAAEIALLELTKQKPAEASAHYNLAQVYLRRHKFFEAAQSARRSLSLRPRYSPAEQLLAEAVRLDRAAVVDNAVSS